MTYIKLQKILKIKYKLFLSDIITDFVYFFKNLENMLNVTHDFTVIQLLLMFLCNISQKKSLVYTFPASVKWLIECF